MSWPDRRVRSLSHLISQAQGCRLLDFFQMSANSAMRLIGLAGMATDYCQMLFAAAFTMPWRCRCRRMHCEMLHCSRRWKSRTRMAEGDNACRSRKRQTRPWWARVLEQRNAPRLASRQSFRSRVHVDPPFRRCTATNVQTHARRVTCRCSALPE